MWIGTFGGGLCELHEANNSFTCYTQKEGLPNDVIYGILEDEQGDLWLSTNQGLSHFNPQTMAFVNYTAIDGLQSNEFNGNAYYRSPSGEMFFGGINGFNAFRPSVVRQKNAFVPPIVLTSLTQANESLAESTTPTNMRTVVLSWPQNFFEFEFAALSFTRPEKNSYAYKLDGFRNEGWNYIGSKRFGRYTNLPGGKYVLRLKGANSDGVWNEEGIAIEITVVPPFWETWWVRGLALLGVVGGIAIGYRWRVRSVEARARELEMQVAQRTHEVEGRRQEIAALYQADEQLYSDLRLEKVLQTLADITVNILAADKAAVLTWDQGHERLRVRVAQGFSEEALRPSSFPCGQTLAAHVAETGSPRDCGERAGWSCRRQASRPKLSKSWQPKAFTRSCTCPSRSMGRCMGFSALPTSGRMPLTKINSSFSAHWCNARPEPLRTRVISMRSTAAPSSSGSLPRSGDRQRCWVQSTRCWSTSSG